MQNLNRRFREPSQVKVERDLQSFDRAASRLLTTISALEATRGTLDRHGRFVNSLSGDFEAIVAARNLIRVRL